MGNTNIEFNINRGRKDHLTSTGGESWNKDGALLFTVDSNELFYNIGDINGDGDVSNNRRQINAGYAIAVGNKEYDQHNELSFIRTFPYSIYKKQETEEFNSEMQYIPRANRIEWQAVCLLGKAIIIDNGNCKPGEYIVPYTGDEYDLAGTGVKYDSTLGIHQKLPKFYVLKRVSGKTVQVLVR